MQKPFQLSFQQVFYCQGRKSTPYQVQTNV